MDTILEQHPELFKIVEADIISGNKLSNFGRKDIPSIERIVRAAIYKEMKGLDYGNWNIIKRIPGYVISF